MMNDKYELSQQSGGNYKNKINIVYYKNYNLKDINDITDPANPKPLLLQEKFDKLYLVTENYEAYQMYNNVDENTYTLTLSVESNKLFKFKFMRNDRLEYLDEDKFLKSINPDLHTSSFTPGAGDASLVWPPNYTFGTEGASNRWANLTVAPGPDLDKTLKSIHNVFIWKTRWRWIYPVEKSNNQIYVFTFYVPQILLVPRTSNLRNNIGLTEDSNPVDYIDAEGCWENYFIQHDKQSINIIKKGQPPSQINIPNVTIGVITDPTNQLNYANILIRHNLGYKNDDTSPVQHFFDPVLAVPNENTTVLKIFNMLSCRNANMLHYIDWLINPLLKNASDNIDYLNTSISSLISGFSNENEKETICDLPSGDLQINISDLNDESIDYSLETNKPFIYFFQQFTHNLKASQNEGKTYNVTIDKFRITLHGVGIDIIDNKYYSTHIKPILDFITKELVYMNGKIFDSLETLSLLQFLDFKLKAHLESKKYLEKWVVLNILKNSYLRNNNFPDPAVKFNSAMIGDVTEITQELIINGISYTHTDWNNANVSLLGLNQDAINVRQRFIDDVLSKFETDSFDEGGGNNFNLLTGNMPTPQNALPDYVIYQTSKLLSTEKMRKLLDINIAFFLTLDWIKTNLLKLLYSFDPPKPVTDAASKIIPDYKNFTYKPRNRLRADGVLFLGSDEVQDKSPLQILNKNIRENISIGDPFTSLYDYLNRFTQLIEFVKTELQKSPTKSVATLGSSAANNFNNKLNDIFKVGVGTETMSNDSINFPIPNPVNNLLILTENAKYETTLASDKNPSINVPLQAIINNGEYKKYFFVKSSNENFPYNNVQTYYINRLNDRLLVYEDVIHKFREYYYMEQVNKTYDGLYDDLISKPSNRKNLFAKILLIMTFLTFPPSISSISMFKEKYPVDDPFVDDPLQGTPFPNGPTLGVNHVEIRPYTFCILQKRNTTPLYLYKYTQEYKTIASANMVNPMQFDDFLDLINNNTTLVQLIKLAIYHIVGKKTIMSIDSRLFEKNEVLNQPLFRDNFYDDTNNTHTSIVFDTPGDFNSIKLFNQVSGISVKEFLENLLVAIEWKPFISEVDKLYKQFINTNSSLQFKFPIFDVNIFTPQT